ncbi:MAG: TraR/DksA family transcriptional regulator [Pseudohongiella sp.]|uniref:TraR/DksA family transcriptional regulator n=1 Tax=Pseudohongiella sp. TaxID=1979412 RepID=UPI0034A0347D
MTDYKHILLQKKAELEAIQADSSQDSKPVELDQAMVGRLSRMDAMQGQAMAQATARRRKEQLQRIEGALRRIDSGDFGYCAICDTDIDPKRLQVDPTLTRCIKCSA